MSCGHTNREAIREADRQQLLKEAARIRGSLRLNKWLIPGLTVGGIAAIIGGITLAADIEEATVAVGVGGLLEVAAVGRGMWSVVKGNTEKSLDNIQRQLFIRHEIMPDRGYFDRAYARNRKELAQKALVEALKRGKAVYDRNRFGHESLKPPYQY